MAETDQIGPKFSPRWNNGVSHSSLYIGTREINVGVEDIISTPVVNPNPTASKDSVQEQDANASTSINIETTEHGSELRATELYFEALYNKPDKHAFYCPNCKACIDKVLLQSTEDEPRCPSCFEFLKPIGDWIFRKPATSKPGIQKVPSDVAKTTDSKIFKIPFDEPKSTPPQQGVVKYEILKSLVYGGLIELITSLGVVTSAASADATTLNIVALALANLITGVFLIGHNLQELKNDQSSVDRYQELLGQKRNFVLHASVAILSFLVFGLVPPVVYGFSFYQSDNRNLKIAVVAAAALLCITVLAIVKAYTQKPSKWSIYITTILYYLSIGIGASGISYLAGYLVRKLIEKLGWFESSVATTQPLSFEKLAWASY
ncbi:membrane protein of ER body 1-like isoform X2 [Castanea sativa]|uniref:membrane protein of ER body 1-like isoform X2 n=1 Tax=Castanea sativa TaxID=21020 RepID=UPI003F64CEF2